MHRPVQAKRVPQSGAIFTEEIAIGEILGIEETQARIANRFNEKLGLGAGEPAQTLLPVVPTPSPIDEQEQEEVEETGNAATPEPGSEWS